MKQLLFALALLFCFTVPATVSYASDGAIIEKVNHAPPDIVSADIDESFILYHFSDNSGVESPTESSSAVTFGKIEKNENEKTLISPILDVGVYQFCSTQNNLNDLRQDYHAYKGNHVFRWC